MTAGFYNLFINWLILHAVGLSSHLLFGRACFGRRHSFVLWWMYFGTRSIIQSYISAASAYGLMTPAMDTANIVFILVTAVTNFAVIIYSWDGEPLKVAVFGVVCDLIAGIAMAVGIFSANMLNGHGMTTDISGLEPMDMVISDVIDMLMVILLIRLLRPLIRWFRNVRFRHRRLLTVAVIVMVSMLSATNLTDYMDVSVSVIMVCLVATLILLPLGIHILRSYRMQRNRQTLLRQQSEMTSAYLIAADIQSEAVDEHSRLLDELKDRIDRSEKDLRSKELASYIAELRQYADELKHGTYSSNLALDAVMTAFEERLARLGFESEMSADGVGSRDTRSAEISWILLKQAEAAAAGAAGEGIRTIRYHVLGMADQLIFDLRVTGAGRMRISRKSLTGYIDRRDALTSEYNSGTAAVRLMTRRETT